jgi:hypothetical protein
MTISFLKLQLSLGGFLEIRNRDFGETSGNTIFFDRKHYLLPMESNSDLDSLRAVSFSLGSAKRLHPVIRFNLDLY